MLNLFGWKVSCTLPDYPKSIICVAPHTSNWDFVLGKFAYWSLGRKAGFIMKASWFFFPMNLLFKAFGGIPVHRGKGSSLTHTLIERFDHTDHLSIAIAPEGTRGKVEEWHTGFLRIAHGANIPVVLGVIDGAHKRILLEKSILTTGDLEADMKTVRDYYKPFVGVKPKNKE